MSLAIGTLVVLSGLAAAPTEMVWGTEGNGTAKDVWTRALSSHLGVEAAKALGAERLPMDGKQMAWAALFMKELPAFNTARKRLDKPFERAPGRVQILLGNRGERDAFTDRDDTIAINLARWQEVYGDAGEGQSDRVQRILAHEYTHLLTRLYKRERRLVTTTAMDRALWTLFSEGLGHYRSLPDRYRPTGPGKPAKDAAIAIAKHSEKLVDALNALAEKPSAEKEAEITVGMVDGAFDEKWGALTVALFIASEVSAGKSEEVVLRRVVRAGPSGILTLVRRNLPDALGRKLPGLRAKATAPKMKALEAPKERRGLDALNR